MRSGRGPFPYPYSRKTDLSRLIYDLVAQHFIELDVIRLIWSMNSFDCTEKYCRSSGSIFYSCGAAVTLPSADCAVRTVNRS